MTVTEILRVMAADAEVCGELVGAARAHSPEVARLTEAESRRHVAAHRPTPCTGGGR